MTLFITILLSFGFLAQSQQKLQVSGKVNDATGISLPGAMVIIEGTLVGTSTDANGVFKIEAPGNATLIISFVGFVSKKVPVNNQTFITVNLETEDKFLSEIMVIGYAEQSRVRNTSAISRFGEDALKNIPSVSPVQALQGKMAGVSVPVLTGQPGAAANIVIRGGTTLRPYGTIHGGNDVTNRDASDPLVIVDGVFRSFTDINPDDIESLQVMKDAASTAIYGANGVIVIKTKSGKGAGKANFTFRYQHGIDTPARQNDYLSAREYPTLSRPVMARGIDYYNVNTALYTILNSATVTPFTTKGQYGIFKFTTAYVDNLVSVEGQEYVDNLLKNGWETMDDPVNPGKTIIFKDSHYQDVVWNTAHTNNYNFAVAGSNDSGNNIKT